MKRRLWTHLLLMAVIVCALCTTVFANAMAEYHYEATDFGMADDATLPVSISDLATFGGIITLLVDEALLEEDASTVDTTGIITIFIGSGQCLTIGDISCPVSLTIDSDDILEIAESGTIVITEDSALVNEGTIVVNDEDALNLALNVGGTVKLGSHISTTGTITITNAITLDLDGYDITANGNGSVFAVNMTNSADIFTLQDSNGANSIRHGGWDSDGTEYTIGSSEGDLITGGVLSGGSVSSGGLGGGVTLTSGTFQMTGGNIASNRSSASDSGGGGVHVSGGTFHMTDGSIIGNSATLGDGVYVSSNGVFQVSGAPNIAVSGTDNDGVYLAPTASILVVGELTTTIPYTLAVSATFHAPTTVAGGDNLNASNFVQADDFTATDTANGSVVLLDGQIKEVLWSYSSTDGVTIHADSTASEIYDGGDMVLTPPASADLTYDGNGKSASLVDDDSNWIADSLTIQHFDSDGGDVTEPINAGTYTAKAFDPNDDSMVLASVTYTIAAMILDGDDFTFIPPAGSTGAGNTVTYDGAPKSASVSNDDVGTITYIYLGTTTGGDSYESTTAPTQAGTYTVSITTTGAGNNGAITEALEVGSFTIAPVETNRVTIGNLDGWTIGASPNLPSVVADFDTPTVTYYTDEACTQAIDGASITTAGTYYVQAVVTGTDNYNGCDAIASFVVSYGEAPVNAYNNPADTWISSYVVTPASGYTLCDANGTDLTSLVFDTSSLNEAGTEIIFYIKDENGLVYEITAIVKIDGTAPAISNITDTADAWHSDSETIAFTATDSLSGIASIVVTCDDGQAVSYSGDSFTADRNGTYTITATDGAGNIATEAVVIAYIDTTAPTISNVTVPSSTWATSETICFTVTDADGSGVETVTVTDENGNAMAVTEGYSFTATATGTYTITVTDHGGNEATQALVITHIDTEAPNIMITEPATSGESLEYTLNVATDLASGVTFTVMDNEGDATIDGTTVTITEAGTYTVTATSGADLEATTTITAWKVTFDPDNNDATTTTLVTHGGAVTQPAPNPTKTNYTFDCWMLGADEYMFSADVTADLALKATWSITPLEPSQISIACADTTAEYGSNGVTLTAIAPALDADSAVEYVYQWYKNGIAVKDANRATLTLNQVSDTGDYTLGIAVVESDGEALSNEAATTVATTVTITPYVVTALDWVGLDIAYTYDGADQSVSISATYTDTDGQKQAVICTWSGDFIHAGDYTIEPSIADSNYVLATGDGADDSVTSQEITMNVAPITVVWTNTTATYGAVSDATTTLYGVMDGDGVVVTYTYYDENGNALDSAPTTAGAYTVTASTEHSNYALTNETSSFTIAKAAVTLQVRGNTAVAGSVTAPTVTTSPAASVTIAYYNGAGNQIDIYTASAGTYTMVATLDDTTNYYLSGAVGNTLNLGSFVITATDDRITTYITGFDDGTTAMYPSIPGTVHTLPTTAVVVENAVFAGWKYGNTLYPAGSAFTQPAADVVLVPQWNTLYAIRGKVLDASSLVISGATLTLTQGSTVIDTDATSVTGEYTSLTASDGTYTLTVEIGGVTATATVIVNGADVTMTDIIVHDYSVKVTVDENAPTVSVTADTLNAVATALNNHIAVEETLKKIEMIVSGDTDAAEETAIANQVNDAIAFSLDIDLVKTVANSNNQDTTSNMTETDTLISIAINLPAQLQNKASYTIYRYHNGAIHTITTKANGYGEYLETSDDHTQLILHVCKFSTYAIAYSETAASTGGNSSVPITVDGDEATISSTTSTTDDNDEDNDFPFADVGEDDWFYDAVVWATEHGITTGKTATLFAPWDINTRAEAATFLWRAMGEPDCVGDSAFTDVEADTFYYDAIIWSVENGITLGISDTTFSPDMSCSRAHVITFLWRMMGKPMAEAENPFEDVTVDDYFYNAVLWAVETGITDGMTATTFAPNIDCTRGQIVTFLYRTLGQ